MFLLLVFLMGFGKKHGFYKRKLGTKDNTRPSFKKERLNVQQTNALRKIVAESPQRRQPPITWPIEVIETVSPCIMSSDSLVAVSPVAEPLSSQSVSLVAQEVIPREIIPRNQTRKKTHHQVPRSPQRRQPQITWPIEVIETVSPCICLLTVLLQFLLLPNLCLLPVSLHKK